MKKNLFTRGAALVMALVLLCSVLWIPTASAAENQTEPAALQETQPEDPGMFPVILGAVAAFVVGNLLIARSRKKQQNKED